MASNSQVSRPVQMPQVGTIVHVLEPNRNPRAALIVTIHDAVDPFSAVGLHVFHDRGTEIYQTVIHKQNADPETMRCWDWTSELNQIPEAPPTPPGPSTGASNSPTVSGPFVDWSNDDGKTAIRALPTLRPVRMPKVNRATVNMIVALTTALGLGLVLLSIVLVGYGAYQQHKGSTSTAIIQSLNSEGRRLYASGDLTGAAAKYEQSLRLSGSGIDSNDAKSSLVVIYNKLGINRFEYGDYKAAETAWFRAHELDPNNVDVNYNLNRLYDRTGGSDSQLQDWKAEQGRRDGEASNASEGTATEGSVLQNRGQNAMDLYNQGVAAYKQGNVDGARTLWEQAIGEAPGTDAARMAKQMMNQTADQPHF